MGFTIHGENLISAGEIMRSEIAEIPLVFQRLIASLPLFNEASKIIRKSECSSVVILARGTSDNAAHFLKSLIENMLGIPVGLASPSSVTIYNTKLQFKNVLVIAISQSGQSPDLVEFSRSALESGATLLSITNDKDSPLAQCSNFHIDLQAGPEIAVAATKTYAAELLASYLLVTSWSGIEPKIEKLIELSEANLEIELAEHVAKFDTKNDTVILGRGYSYANAREAALKIQETSKVPVQAYSIADYLHGPISALKSTTNVVLLAPLSLPLASLAEVLTRIRNAGCPIFWIGRDDQLMEGDSFLGGANVEDDAVSTIVDSILLQRFAHEVAITNGFNPDSPKGLSKVTLTL